MTDVVLDRDVDELAGVVVGLLSLKGRLRVAAPEDVAKLKRQLGGSCGAGGTALPADCGLFLRAASLLSEQSEALTMGELSRALEVPLSTATRVVDWQVDHGYMERWTDPEDRRLVRVALSENGRELFREIAAVLKERIRRLAVAFTPEERESLIPLLRKLVTVLSELHAAHVESGVASE